MEQLFPLLGNWVWFVAAGIFLLLELVSPGVFFIWLGVAAALTGVIDNLHDLPWQGEPLQLPPLYQAGQLAAVGIGLVFFAVSSWRTGRDEASLVSALDAVQAVLLQLAAELEQSVRWFDRVAPSAPGPYTCPRLSPSRCPRAAAPA